MNIFRIHEENIGRQCNMENVIGGVCLYLCMNFECSNVPNSLCLKYADKIKNPSGRLKRRIEKAKKKGLYEGKHACAAF